MISFPHINYLDRFFYSTNHLPQIKRCILMVSLPTNQPPMLPNFSALVSEKKHFCSWKTRLAERADLIGMAFSYKGNPSCIYSIFPSSHHLIGPCLISNLTSYFYYLIKIELFFYQNHSSPLLLQVCFHLYHPKLLR